MESEEREAATGRSRNVVHILPQSIDSVPRFLTGPLERVDPIAGGTQLVVLTQDPESAVALAEAVLAMTGMAGIELFPVTSARRAFPTFEQPRHFVAAIRSIVGCYVVAVGLFIVGILLRAWH